MSRIEDDVDDGLDRRNFLKKTGAVGALGVATPLLVQSVLNPAAACSGPNVTAVSGLTGTTSTANWQASANNFVVAGEVTGDNQGQYAAVNGTNFIGGYSTNLSAIASNVLVIVAFAIDGTSQATPSVRLITVGTTTTAPGLTLTQVNRVTSDGTTLYVYSGTTTQAIPAATRTLYIELAANEGDAFVGHVIQVTASGGSPVIVSNTTGSGTGSTTSALSFTPTGSAAELIVANFGIDHGPGAGANNITSGTTATNTPVGTDFTAIFGSDYVNDAAVNEQALGSHFSHKSSAATTVTFTRQAGTNTPTSVTWRAIAIELDC